MQKIYQKILEKCSTDFDEMCEDTVCDGIVENMFLNDPCVPHQSREENKKQALAAKREKRKEKRKKKKEEQKRKQEEEEEGQKTKEDFSEMQEQKEDSAEGNGLCSLSKPDE